MLGCLLPCFPVEDVSPSVAQGTPFNG